MNGMTLKLEMHGRIGEQAYILEITPEQAKEMRDVLERAYSNCPEKDCKAMARVMQIVHSVTTGWIEGMQKH